MAQQLVIVHLQFDGSDLIYTVLNQLKASNPNPCCRPPLFPLPLPSSASTRHSRPMQIHLTPF
jgi:hypothetical protein